MSLKLINRGTSPKSIGDEELRSAAIEASFLDFFEFCPDWARDSVRHAVVHGTPEHNGGKKHLISSLRCVISINEKWGRDADRAREARERENSQGGTGYREYLARKAEKQERDRRLRQRMKGDSKKKKA